jgi:hypothetical protein
MRLAVLLAVVEHASQYVLDGAIVTAAVAGGQDDNVLVPRGARIAAPTVGVLWYVPVPFRLALEVARLRDVVVGGDDGCYCLARRVVAVVFDRHMAVEAEQNNDGGDGRNGQY